MTHQVILLSFAAFAMLVSVACQNSPGRPQSVLQGDPAGRDYGLRDSLSAELRGVPRAAQAAGARRFRLPIRFSSQLPTTRRFAAPHPTECPELRCRPSPRARAAC